MMSNKILNRVWEDQTIKRAVDRLLLVSLADQANDDGICWPGIGSLTKRLVCSRPTVIKAIENLERAGAIVVFERQYKSHYYLICVGMSEKERRAAVRLVTSQVGATPREPRPEPSKEAFTSKYSRTSEDGQTSKDGFTSKRGFTRVVKPSLPPLVNTGLPKPSENHQQPSTPDSGSSVDDYDEVSKIYVDEMGHFLTPMLSAKLHNLIAEFGADWVIDAIGITSKNNVRRMNYVEAILKNWQRDGRQDRPKTKQNGGTASAANDEMGGFYV